MTAVLGHRLLSPKKHVDKCYYAKVRGEVTDQDVRRFAEGICIGSPERKAGRTEPAPPELEILKVTQETLRKALWSLVSEILLTIQEGKFHQVKRMFLAVGKEVMYLKRLSMGSLKLDQGWRPETFGGLLMRRSRSYEKYAGKCRCCHL